VKSWEPPLDEFLDFIGDVRRSLPPEAPVVVSPLGAGPESFPVPPPARELEIWREKLKSLGDPWLTVRSPGEGGTG
jgi:hypothetical protein